MINYERCYSRRVTKHDLWYLLETVKSGRLHIDSGPMLAYILQGYKAVCKNICSEYWELTLKGLRLRQLLQLDRPLDSLVSINIQKYPTDPQIHCKEFYYIP